MLEEDDLIQGSCYFLVWYYDDDLRIPDIETYIFIGKNVLPSDKEDDERWYFQNPESYLKKGSFIKTNDGSDCGVFRTDQETLETIYDLEGLIGTLAEIKM